MIDFQRLNSIQPIANQRWATTFASLGVMTMKLPPGVSIRIENLEQLPDEPVIVAMNHTHMFDFVALRAPLFFKKRTFVSWVKARAYKSPHMNLFLSKTGNVPLCSRGYIMAADYFDLFGERIDEETYRHLRAHVDHGQPLPDGPKFERLQSIARPMLGWQFNPSGISYRESIQSVYYELMQISLRLTRRCINRGDHVHVYPQGSVAAQLIPGRIGTVQAALAFGLPIVTVGVSGFREVFCHPTNPVPMGQGEVVVCFGNMHMVPREEFPEDFRPFHPVDEQRQRSKLMAYTQTIMQDLNAQLEPSYQWADDMQSDAKVGVNRFF